MSSQTTLGNLPTPDTSAALLESLDETWRTWRKLDGLAELMSHQHDDSAQSNVALLVCELVSDMRQHLQDACRLAVAVAPKVNLAA